MSGAQIFGVGMVALAAGIWIGAHVEHWYLRAKYRMTPRWGRLSVELEG